MRFFDKIVPLRDAFSADLVWPSRELLDEELFLFSGESRIFAPDLYGALTDSLLSLFPMDLVHRKFYNELSDDEGGTSVEPKRYKTLPALLRAARSMERERDQLRHYHCFSFGETGGYWLCNVEFNDSELDDLRLFPSYYDFENETLRRTPSNSPSYRDRNLGETDYLKFGEGDKTDFSDDDDIREFNWYLKDLPTWKLSTNSHRGKYQCNKAIPNERRMESVAVNLPEEVLDGDIEKLQLSVRELLSADLELIGIGEDWRLFFPADTVIANGLYAFGKCFLDIEMKLPNMRYESSRVGVWIREGNSFHTRHWFF